MRSSSDPHHQSHNQQHRNRGQNDVVVPKSARKQSQLFEHDIEGGQLRGDGHFEKVWKRNFFFFSILNFSLNDCEKLNMAS